MGYPRRITPNSQTRRRLYFDAADIDLLAKRLSKRFWHTFTRGFPLSFSHGDDHLAFSPTRPLSPSAARRHLRGLAVNPRLIEMAVNAIGRYDKEGFPKPDHIRFDLWFRSLSPKLFPADKIKEAVAPDVANLKKWERKLEVCGRNWDDLSLTDGAVVRVTRKLFKDVLKREVTDAALRKHLRRWKKGDWSVRLHGHGTYEVPPEAVIDV